MSLLLPISLPLWALLSACDPAAPPADPAPAELVPADADEPDEEAAEEEAAAATLEPTLVSPSDGAVIRVGWTPVMVSLPEAAGLGARVRLTLDGRPYDDPMGLVRSRWEAKGGGIDYLSSLDLGALEPGEHALQIQVEPETGEPYTLAGRFTWDRPPCPVDLSIVDEAGAPLAGRVLLQDAQGPVRQVGPDAARVDPMARDTALDAVFVVGQRRIWLDPGPWSLLAVQGVRREVDQQALELPSDCAAAVQVRLVLPLAVPTPGWLAADLHVHTGLSGDSFVPDRQRFESLAAAGLDLVVITDHKKIRDASDRMALVAASPRLVPGDEARVGTPFRRKAHFNFFPLDAGAPPAGPTDGAVVPRPALAYDLWRARQDAHPYDAVGTPVLVQLNHPRGLMIHPTDEPSWTGYGLFGRGDLVRDTPLGQGDNAWVTRPEAETGTTVLDFDLLEVLNRFSWRQYLQVREDWFLLNHLGRFPTGTGNSDSHALAVELAGFPVNLVQAEGDVPGFVAALQQGAVTVSGGPVVELQVRAGEQVAGPGHQVSGREVEAVLRVRAASWVPVEEARLVVDGKVHQRIPLPSPLPPEGHTVRIPLSLSRDAWVLAEAGHPLDAPRPDSADLGIFGRVAPGYVPVGFTNPVRIDADGDGQWTARTPLEAAALAAEGLPMPGPPTRKRKAKARPAGDAAPR